MNSWKSSPELYLKEKHKVTHWLEGDKVPGMALNTGVTHKFIYEGNKANGQVHVEGKERTYGSWRKQEVFIGKTS